MSWASRTFGVLALGAGLLVSPSALAEDKPSPVTTTPIPTSTVKPPIEPVIVPVKPGSVVPWPGLLLNAAAVAQIKVELDTAKEQCAIITKKAVDEQKAQDDFQLAQQQAEAKRAQAVLQASLKSRTDEVADLSKRLEKSEKDRPNVYLWTGLGFAAGTVVTVLTVFAVSQASK